MSTLLELDELLTGEQVGERIGVSRQRVQQLIGRPDFPPAVGRVGKATVWRAGDVDDYLRGVRAFFTVNGVSIGVEKARELAARLNRAAQGARSSVPGRIAEKIEAQLETGGGITVADEEAEALFGALQEWLEQTSVDVFGDRMMTLRYRLFGELQDAGRIPRS